MIRSARPILLAAAMAVLVAGCGSDNKVGSDELTDFKEGTTSTRLGQTTTTAPPETTTTTNASGGTGTTAKATTTTTQQVSLNISILGTSPWFDPNIGCTQPNALVRWTNKDTQVRSVLIAGVSSGPIAPGGIFDFKAPSTKTDVRYTEDSSVPGYRPFADGHLNTSC
jgi:hypothetical protein